MKVLVLFPLKCSKRKLISSSLDEILYIRVCLVLAVDQHIFQVFLAGKTEEELCIRKVRESLPFHLRGTHQYIFTVQILSRNAVLKSTAISKRQRFCYNRINPHQNSFILWRSGCDYMKEEPVHTVAEWSPYFQWLPRSTRKV